MIFACSDLGTVFSSSEDTFSRSPPFERANLKFISIFVYFVLLSSTYNQAVKMLLFLTISLNHPSFRRKHIACFFLLLFFKPLVLL